MMVMMKMTKVDNNEVITTDGNGCNDDDGVFVTIMMKTLTN